MFFFGLFVILPPILLQEVIILSMDEVRSLDAELRQTTMV